MPARLQQIVRHATDVLIALGIVALIWQGLDMALQEGVMRMPALRITYFWVFLAMPIGALAMLFQLVAKQFLPVSFHVGEDEVGGDSVI